MKKKLKLIVVEDSEDDALLIERELQKVYQVDLQRVETAEELTRLLNQQEWDLILADYSLPHFNGLGALAIKQTEATDLPFIIVSGTIGETAAVAAMRAGAQDYIMKDDLARLLPAVERCLREAVVRIERKEAELALQRSEQKNRELVELMTEGLVVGSNDNKILMVNDRFCEMIGYPREYLLNKQIEGFLDEENREIFEKSLKNRQIGKRHVYELTVTRANNTKLVMLVSSISLPDHEDFNGRIAVITDITERKLTEEKLLNTTKELISERKSLTESNVALKRILEHIEEEKNSFKDNLFDEINYQLNQAIEVAERRESSAVTKELTNLVNRIRALLVKDTNEFQGRLLSLSPREAEICSLIREGMSSKQISEKLNLSTLTVHKHREQIRKKLLINNKNVNLSTYLRTQQADSVLLDTESN